VAKTWVLDTDTKGTGAQVRPLDDVLEKPAERPRDGARPGPRKEAAAAKPKPPNPAPRRQTSSTPLAPDQVRKKSTGEIGKLRSVDARTGTAVVHWLREGRTTTVSLTAISRR
jgi:hypothetical protein